MTSMRLKELLAEVDGGELLDIATGSGGFIATLTASLRSYSSFTGVDINPVELAEAQKQFPNARFELADANRLPFPHHSFDTVTISNSLHHLPDLPPVFTEMKRVLRPGGTMVIREMYRDHQPESRLTHVLAHDWWAEINTALGEYHRPAYNRQKLLDIIADNELSGVRMVELTAEDQDPFNPETIEQFARRNRQVLEKLRDTTDRETHRTRCEALIARARRVGVLPSATLTAIGRVPV